MRAEDLRRKMQRDRMEGALIAAACGVLDRAMPEGSTLSSLPFAADDYDPVWGYDMVRAAWRFLNRAERFANRMATDPDAPVLAALLTDVEESGFMFESLAYYREIARAFEAARLLSDR